MDWERDKRRSYMGMAIERSSLPLGSCESCKMRASSDRWASAVRCLSHLDHVDGSQKIYPGYPLPTLLRLAILVKHTAPYKPLDVVMSFCHLNLQNRTLLDFKTAFERRAGVKRVLAASPLSMKLLTPNPPAWHPAPENFKEAVKDAVQVSKGPDGESGLPELALQYAFQRAREVGIPTVVGLGSLKDVHENAQIWYSVDKQGLGESEAWKQRVQEVISVFGNGDGGLLDRSWENPRFSE